MIYLRKFKYAAEMTFKTYRMSSKNKSKRNNNPKDYLELFIELFKCYE